jgi:hypothetical protein
MASTPVRAVQPEQNACNSRSRTASPVTACSACNARLAAAAAPGGRARRGCADDDYEQDARDEAVGGDGERSSGLLDSAQLGHDDHGDSCGRQCHLVLSQRREGGDDVVHARDDADGDGEDVVDEESTDGHQ